MNQKPTPKYTKIRQPATGDFRRYTPVDTWYAWKGAVILGTGMHNNETMGTPTIRAVGK